MPEPILSTVLHEAAKKAGAIVKNEFRLQLSVKNDIKSLEKNLKLIQGYLNDAEKKQHSDEAVKRWLQDLEDFACDAEDVLDEVSTEALLKEVVESQDWLRQVSDFFLSCFTCSILKPLVFRRGVAKRIEEIRESLDQTISTGRQLDLQQIVAQAGKGSDTGSVRETTSRGNSRVVGREEEIGHLLGLLLPPGGNKDAVPQSSPRHASTPQSGSGAAAALRFSAISVAGMGGVGKTTLVQEVCWRKKVTDFFPLRIWAHVSRNLDVNKLIRNIISLATRRIPDPTCSLEDLKTQLEEAVKDRLFLIVLDDVWTPEQKLWEDLRWPLNSCKMGSKVIITTRTVGNDTTHVPTERIKLERLSEDDCWLVFRNSALTPGDEPPSQLLEKIGKGIVKKADGLPLAAKALGRLVNTYGPDPRLWSNVLNGDIPQLEEDEVGIIPVLGLSYYQLPTPQKRCFAYCSLFPKGYVFHKFWLIHIWIALGFVRAAGVKRLEDVGSDYLEALVSRSFFEQSDQGGFVMHDLMHDLAQSVSGDECYRIVGCNYSSIPENVRHLSLSEVNRQLLKHLHGFPQLRSLIFVDPYASISVHDLHKLLKRLRNLRVLILCHIRKSPGGSDGFWSCLFPSHLCGIRSDELPHSIGSLTHLRYLLVQGCSTLPESLGNLYNLQYLTLKGSDKLEILPRGFTKLVNLRHLETDADGNGCQIAGFGDLTPLQDMNKFHVVRESGHMIGQLKHLNVLQGELFISGLENVSSEEAADANLEKKCYLDTLELEWGSRRADLINPKHDAEVLKCLKPNANLQNLVIKGYGGDEYPQWLLDHSLIFLETLRLVGCQQQEILPPLGEFPSLRELEMTKMHEGQQSGCFQLCGGRNYIETLFPKLQTLRIQSSLSMSVFPTLPSTLIELDIDTQTITIKVTPFRRRRRKGRLSPVNELQLSKCTDKKVQWIWKELMPHHLRQVEKLSISKCKQMVSLPRDAFEALRALTTLSVVECPMLRQLPSLPTELRELKLSKLGLSVLPEIIGCSSNGLAQSSTKESTSSSLSSSSCLSILEISKCPNLQSLSEWLLTHHLTGLQKLIINDVISLVSMPRELFEGLSSLAYLDISNSPKLTELPPLPPTLEYLGLDNVGLLALPEFQSSSASSSSGPSLRRLDVSECHALTSLCQGLLEQELRALEEVFICCCNRLVSLPGFEAFSSLRLLTLFGCRNLSLLPWASAPASLKTLEMDDCPLLMEQYLTEAPFFLPKISPPQIAQIDDRWRRVTWMLKSEEEDSVSYIPARMQCPDDSEDETSPLLNKEEETSTSYVSRQMPSSVVRVTRPPKKREREKPYSRGRRFEILFQRQNDLCYL